MKRAAVPSILVAVVLLALGVTVEAQQPKKVPRIGYLSPTDPATESARSEGIQLALRERGYIEGQNIAIEYRYAEGKRDRFSELAAELVRLKIDIIVAAGGDTVVRAAKNATKTIPIVMVGAGLDPVEAGLVESLARPGSNVTGLTYLNKELGGKRLELSCSKKPFQKLPVSRFSTNRSVRTVYARSKRFSQSRRVRWG
jgi:putative ABC transport system substrate-binding protein